MIAFDLLTQLRGAGVHLEASDDDKLIAKANAGVLTPGRRSQIAEAKPALLAALDLERRIRRMAQRWRYSAEELAEVLELAKAQPQAWLRAIELDERRFGVGDEIERCPTGVSQ